AFFSVAPVALGKRLALERGAPDGAALGLPWVFEAMRCSGLPLLASNPDFTSGVCGARFSSLRLSRLLAVPAARLLAGTWRRAPDLPGFISITVSSKMASRLRSKHERNLSLNGKQQYRCR